MSSMEQQDKHTGDQHPTVVHAINNLDVGGVETMALETIRQFQDWGENRLVVVDGRQQPRRPAFDELGIPVSVWDHRPGEYGSLVKKSFQYFQSVNADALLCWSYGNHAFVGLGAWLSGVSRSAVSVQNAPPQDTTRLWKWRLLGWGGLPAVQSMVTCSDYVQKQMTARVKIPARRLSTAYNSCDVRAVHEAAAAAPSSETEGPVVGMVARLNEIKDHSTLIKAMQYVREEYSGAELWLIGDGERRDALERRTEELDLQDTVRFFGNRDDVPGLLGQMDVFAFATTGAEGFGIVIVEALAAGLPVVATDVGPCAEVLQQGEWGRLVREGDSKAVAEGILEAIEGDVQPPDLQQVYERFDTQASAKRYWSLLFDETPKT
jgi:glycosyltransferase involved in cell wall biosynthesis